MKILSCRQSPLRVIWHVEKSYAGKLMVGMTEKKEICRVSFLRGDKTSKVIAGWRQSWPETEFILEPTNKARRKTISERKILLTGTAFQCAVWRALATIPCGQTRYYGDVARQIGRSKAVRAVGGACGANPVPFFIPCHRVVAANGLGGFSGGINIKKTLLKKEHSSI